MLSVLSRLTLRGSKEVQALAETEVVLPVHEGAWIGVDLDGTLAKFNSWRGLKHVGRIVPSMKLRIQRWLQAGYQVKIITARASIPESLPPIEKWLHKQGLGGLEITNKVDANMVELWDDRAIHMQANSGIPVRSMSVFARPRAPLLEEAFPQEKRPQLSFLTPHAQG